VSLFTVLCVCVCLFVCYHGYSKTVMLKLADRTCDGSGTTALCWAKLDQIQDHLAKISRED